MPLPPGEYRLDLDPAGYPFNLSPTESSYGFQVTAGSYTKLNIPLNPSYTVVGSEIVIPNSELRTPNSPKYQFFSQS